MKKLTTLFVVSALLVFVVALDQSYACGTCGCTPSEKMGKLQNSKSQDVKLSGNAAMPCGCSMTAESMQMHQNMNVLDMAKHAGNFNTLIKAIEVAGLEDMLRSNGTYTVFAPTDEAFAKLPEGELDKLLKDKKRLREVLSYHLLPTVKTSDEVVKLSSLDTVNGQKASVSVEPCGVMIDHSTITSTDIRCSNGVIHVIDRVMLPEEITS